jgi:hypothetical protein
MVAHLVTTADPVRARRFADAAEVHRLWTAPSGLPYPRNAPLTAWTIAVVSVDDRAHAGLGLGCDLCGGPCRIDEVTL